MLLANEDISARALSNESSKRAYDGGVLRKSSSNWTDCQTRRIRTQCERLLVTHTVVFVELVKVDSLPY